jgi:hypothetical protein
VAVTLCNRLSVTLSLHLRRYIHSTSPQQVQFYWPVTSHFLPTPHHLPAEDPCLAMGRVMANRIMRTCMGVIRMGMGTGMRPPSHMGLHLLLPLEHMQGLGSHPPSMAL